jgi:polar amino acid transport system substrate-binding protein
MRLRSKARLWKLLIFFSCLLWPLATIAVQKSPTGSRVIVVGGDRDYPPYEFLDKNGNPAGYNVDLTRAIAEVMGMKVEFRLGSWSEMREALQSGAVDVLQGMSYSEERAGEVDFSLPHTVVNHVVFARRDSPNVNTLAELEGKSVAVHRSGIMHDYLVRTHFSGRPPLR